MSNASKKLDQLIQQAAVSEGPAPQQDMWRGIEHSITRANQTTGKWLNWVWASAACMVLAVGTVTFMQMQPPAVDAVANKQTQMLLTMLETQHQLQREAITMGFQKAGIDSNNEVASAEISQIRQAISEVRIQLLDEPDNQALWQLLQWLHSKELQLLESQYRASAKWQQI